MSCRQLGMLAAVLLMAARANGQETEAAEPIPLSPRGADTCLACHDASSEFPVLSIFRTRHALGSDPASPFAQLQ